MPATTSETIGMRLAPRQAHKIPSSLDSRQYKVADPNIQYSAVKLAL